MATNPIQQLAQELETTGVTLSEEVIAADPQAFPTVTWDQINEAAGKLWLEAGGDVNTPYTLDFWLEAEDSLKTQTP